MNMKYFRFLHYETGACLAHFGELEDTAEERKFSFLYLRGTKKHVNQTETEHTLFLCPNFVDLVVLGQVDGRTEEALQSLLKHTKVGMLVIPEKVKAQISRKKSAQIPGKNHLQMSEKRDLQEPDSQETEMLNCLEGVGQVERHPVQEKEIPDRPDGAGQMERHPVQEKEIPDCLEGVGQMERHPVQEKEIPDRLDGVGQVVRLQAQEKLRLGGTKGWNILVTCWTEGALAMLHGVNRRDQELGLFDDCVMNVKRLDSSRRCGKTQKPDGYGCALGCVLHQDFDVCKYRAQGQSVLSLTGTVLTAGEGSAEEWEKLERALYEEGVHIRFFSLQNSRACGWWSLLRNRRDRSEPRRYYIGSETEMSDRMIASLCRDGFNQIPVALREDEGICCSGLLNYKEEAAQREQEELRKDTKDGHAA